MPLTAGRHEPSLPLLVWVSLPHQLQCLLVVCTAHLPLIAGCQHAPSLTSYDVLMSYVRTTRTGLQRHQESNWRLRAWSAWQTPGLHLEAPKRLDRCGAAQAACGLRSAAPSPPYRALYTPARRISYIVLQTKTSCT